MKKDKPKRETAIKNIRIYPSSLEKYQRLSLHTGKSIARLVDESYDFAGWKFETK